MRNLNEFHTRYSQPWLYAIAIYIFAISLFLRLQIAPAESGYPFVTFYPAMVVAFYLCGIRPGMAVAVLSAVAAYFFFIPRLLTPYGTNEGYIAIAAFLFSAYLIGLIIHQLKAYAIKSRSLFENSFTGMIAIDPSSGHIVDANQTALDMWGYDIEEFLTRTKDNLTHPDDLAESRQRNEQLAKGMVDHLRFEKRYLRKNGSYFWAETCSSTVKDAKGKVNLFIVSAIDISARKKSEEMLRFHSEILNNLSEGVFLIRSSDEKIVYANPRFEQMFGYDHDELLGMHISIVNAPSEITPETRAKAINSELEAHGVWNGEVQNIRKDGKTFWCHVSVSTYEHPEFGQVWVAAHDDITEHKQMEINLRESENRRHLLEQKEIVQTSLDGFCVVRTSDGQILDTNDIFCKMVGYSRQEVLAMGIHHLEIKESAEETEAHLIKIMNIGYDRFETRHRHKQGHLIDFEVSVSYSNVKGGVNFAFFRDITERKRTEKTVRLSYDQLKRFIQQAPISIAMFDRNMNYLAVSGRWMVEYGQGYTDLIGRNHYVVHPNMPTEWEMAHQEGLAGATLEKKEDLSIQPDGSKRWLHWVVQPWFDENKKIGGIIITTENITDTKMLEIEVAEHRKEMEQLQKMHVAAQTASAIAHEINQPLLAIASYSQAALMMMKAEKFDFNEIYNAIEKSEQQALRAGRSIRDLLNYLSKREFPIELFDLNKEVIDIVGTAKSEHNLVFHSVLNLEEGLPLVRANRAHIQKVLLNLLHNGLDAMQAAGIPLPAITVTVCTTKDNNFAQLTIQDNGPGIKKEDINRLFQPFFTTKTKGIGMGLAISRSLIEENGGQLWVDPQEGPGAIFHLTLPLACEI